MKKRRFEELHRKAIRWPEGKLNYVGIDSNKKHITDEAKKGEVRLHARASTTRKLIVLGQPAH